MTSKNHYFLKLAIKKAKESFDSDNFPVGAVLSINDKFLDSGNNTCEDTSNFTNHAENALIIKNGNELLNAWKKGKHIILYSTLEPCLMCLGTAVMNKVSKIIYIQKDPHAGACSIDTKSMGIRYREEFPEIIQDNFSEIPKELIEKFLQNQINRGYRTEWSQKFLKRINNYENK